ncbi:DNA replication complex GINS protein SLD5 [Anopheles nili]|uniref:DNA replication complex GINS protein SLD5 n=1 Tax=Anopheles nili TaxID=185578 RepID=UPI00237C431E|nr:DNA replication complex GINS protein SLD5 [Anopheles nili]
MENGFLDSAHQSENGIDAAFPRYTDIEDVNEQDVEEIQMSPQEVLESLQRAWINEKFSPDLLPYQDVLVEMIMIQLVHMEENLATANKNDLLYMVHRMEVERIRYIVASYLRCRLQKLEAYTSHVLDAESHRPDSAKRLSDAEHKFALDFHKSVENHYYQLVVRHMPQNQQDDKLVRQVVPNLDTHVFARARQNVGEYSLGGGEHSVNIMSGSVLLFKYRDIEPLLIEGLLELI